MGNTDFRIGVWPDKFGGADKQRGSVLVGGDDLPGGRVGECAGGVDSDVGQSDFDGDISISGVFGMGG